MFLEAVAAFANALVLFQARHKYQWRKCRKLPVVVEYCEVPGGKKFAVATREGVLEAYPETDYLIKGVDGEIYPIKKEIFHRTYEVLADGQAGQ